jgi:hypothetical protein
MRKCLQGRWASELGVPVIADEVSAVGAEGKGGRLRRHWRGDVEPSVATDVGDLVRPYIEASLEPMREPGLALAGGRSLTL